ncbi:MAG TPA: response regulator [Gemmatimonadaceae bacterium]|nr:response regulator [Gemmatimonadaceae bacterium]
MALEEPPSHRVMSDRAPRVTLAVIEDDASMLFALASLLTASGFGVAPFASAEDFLESLPRLTIAGVVSDVYLSGMTAVALQTHLAERGIDLPMVYITGHDDPTTRALLRGAGVTSWLHKPFDEALLLREVERVVSKAPSTPAGTSRTRKS